jgi:LemA protein
MLMPISTPILILIGAIILLIGWIIAVFNRLVTLKNRTNEAWSDIDVQLKRRYDLIPNLIETVKGYAKHESSTFESVIKARNVAMQPHNHHDQAAAEKALSGAVMNLFALAENYPDLKASQNFMQLQDELRDAEDKIQASRRFYNANSRDFNTAMETFPSNVIAKRMGFTRFDFFEIGDAAQRENVSVKF